MKWSNLASHKAGVTVVVVAIGQAPTGSRSLFVSESDDSVTVRTGSAITPYLTLGPWLVVSKATTPISALSAMEFGNKPSDGGNLLLRARDIAELRLNGTQNKRFVRRIYGSDEFINGGSRFCLWIEDAHREEAMGIEGIRKRVEAVRSLRLASPDKGAQALAKRAHQMKLMRIGRVHTVVVPAISSERRPYLPVGLTDNRAAINNKAYALYDAPIWNMALIASRLHWVWIGTVCVRMRTDFSYSNTLGWNTFPVPTLTEQNKADLTRCAEDILLTREAHFPATIADLYNPEAMPANLRAAHEANDETLERIYIGRRFRNDTERLETLFAMYARMTATPEPAKAKLAGKRRAGAGQ